MKFKQLLDLVEIRVVIPSLAPLLLGITYSAWRYQRINWLNTALLVLATVSVHLAVNTFNRYEDNKRQVSNEFIRESGTPNDGPAVTEKTVLKVALFLGILAAVAGIAVALLTTYVTWIIGILSFAVGYLYSAGPKPITNTPFGEFVSGITMGYFIFVAEVYVDTLLPITLMVLLRWFLVSLPLVLLIANIMLANNISDHEEDEENNRHTLVHYLGLTAAKRLYLAWVGLAYFEIFLLTLVGWLPLTCWAMVALLPLVWQKARAFVNHPVKEETFILAIQNLTLTMLGLALTIFIGLYI
ncbi:UbiA family prenyltransferase [Eupransor demetentiae]|uniref:1 n=1 Tax=Eupransor demetentiae TaxID=3109584 RepID=A0ABP0ESL8_9LACO|nr:1 [Lactobacillaceae bacterium LMG 33000] [Lactobacillaceae bacterium LMG 33000]